MTEKVEETQGDGEQEEGKKEEKPKGQIYIPLVEENKDIHFFRYPRLGCFYAVVMKVKSYLYEKLFDSNIVKVQAFKQAKEQYEK